MEVRALGPVDTLFAQITHAARSASRKETPLLPVCCLTQQTYRETRGVNPADCLQTHTYCPGCFTQVMETIRAAQVMETLLVA